MTRASEIARMAYLVARATDSDQSAFDPDTEIKPGIKRPALLPLSDSRALGLADKTFHARKTDRVLRNVSVDLAHMTRIATAAYGYLENGHRTVPSAGSYYPLVLHVCQVVNGQITDVHLFDPTTHQLLKSHSVNLPVQDGFFVYGVDFNTVSFILIWSCRIAGIASKYGAKGYRFTCIEIGHSAQMAVLECLIWSFRHVLLGGLNETWLQENVICCGRRFAPQYALMV